MFTFMFADQRDVLSTEFTTSQEFQGSNTLAGEFFGRHVAIDGDTCVVGSDLGGSSNTGTAYIFTYNGTTWSEQQQLTSVGGDFSNYGFSVAVEGDTCAIGAPWDDHGGGANNNYGAVYVYTRSGSVWTLEDTLLPSDPTTNGEFGYSVALSGDTCVIGARGNEVNGSVYVFTRSGSVWTQQQKITEPQVSSAFGKRVDVEGDKLIVGAESDDTVGLLTGAAYVYTRSGSTWSSAATLNDSNLIGVGVDVGMYGNKVIVGSKSSKAIVYENTTGNTWVELQQLEGSDVVSTDRFGWTVDIFDQTCVVGAYEDDPSSTGAAYIFIGNQTWQETQKLTAITPAGDEMFGYDVALTDDAVICSQRGLTSSDQGYVTVFNREQTPY